MKSKWTTDDIGNMRGKVALVTGANTGIGYEAAKVFAEKGARVVMACRSADKGNAARDKIVAASDGADTVVMALDLANLKSVRAFTKKFMSEYDRLDILLNNAGIMSTPFGKTADGFEQQMGVNHLGHFALTGLLMGVLKKTPDARVVCISSNAHMMGTMDDEHLMSESKKGYHKMRAYANSKLANILFANELQRRAKAAGLSLQALAAHPGAAATELGRYYEGRFFYHMYQKLWPSMAQSAVMGALPGVRAAADEEAGGGQYYGPDGRFGMKGGPVRTDSSKASHSGEDARRLWEVSEKLTGVKYDFGK